jgi:fermentation-respiration switch protein FrsA (DUF1100 family)
MFVYSFEKKISLVRIIMLLFLVLGFISLTGCANGVFYQPSARMWAPPDGRGVAYREVRLTAPDGTKLEGWWLPAKGETEGVVVHFHGNAQNRSTHVRFVEWLPAEGFAVLAFDYRGYAGSEGTPTRKGLVRDGVAALVYGARRATELDVPLFVWGQSLGGTVAVQAMDHAGVEVEAALIDSTFTSHRDIVRDKLREFPWFLRWLGLLRPLLISDGWDAEDVIGDLGETRLLFMHGERDPVIPPPHSRRLHGMAPEGAELWMIGEAGHCDAVLRYPDKVRPRILRFLRGAGDAVP